MRHFNAGIKVLVNQNFDSEALKYAYFNAGILMLR